MNWKKRVCRLWWRMIGSKNEGYGWIKRKDEAERMHHQWLQFYRKSFFSLVVDAALASVEVFLLLF